MRIVCFGWGFGSRSWFLFGRSCLWLVFGVDLACCSGVFYGKAITLYARLSSIFFSRFLSTSYILSDGTSSSIPSRATTFIAQSSSPSFFTRTSIDQQGISWSFFFLHSCACSLEVWTCSLSFRLHGTFPRLPFVRSQVANLVVWVGLSACLVWCCLGFWIGFYCGVP